MKNEPKNTSQFLHTETINCYTISTHCINLSKLRLKVENLILSGLWYFEINFMVKANILTIQPPDINRTKYWPIFLHGISRQENSNEVHEYTWKIRAKNRVHMDGYHHLKTCFNINTEIVSILCTYKRCQKYFRQDSRRLIL